MLPDPIIAACYLEESVRENIIKLIQENKMTKENTSAVGADLGINPHKFMKEVLFGLRYSDPYFYFFQIGRRLGKSCMTNEYFKIWDEVYNKPDTIKIHGLEIPVKSKNMKYGPQSHKKWKNK